MMSLLCIVFTQLSLSWFSLLKIPRPGYRDITQSGYWQPFALLMRCVKFEQSNP